MYRNSLDFGVCRLEWCRFCFSIILCPTSRQNSEIWRKKTMIGFLLWIHKGGLLPLQRYSSSEGKNFGKCLSLSQIINCIKKKHIVVDKFDPHLFSYFCRGGAVVLFEPSSFSPTVFLLPSTLLLAFDRKNINWLWSSDELILNCIWNCYCIDVLAKVGHAQGSNAEGRNSKEEKPRDRRLVEPSATEGAEASQLQIIDCRLLGNICFCFKCSRLWYQGARMESFVLTGLSGSFWLTRLTGAMFVERAKQFATCSKTSKQFVQLIYRAL